MSVFLDSNNVLAGGRSGVVDPRKGGQMGHKRDASFWFHQSLYVKQPIQAVLLAAPKAFRFLPDGDVLASMLKSLVELHATSITGLNQTITNEFDEKPAGMSNEVMQTPLRSTRERSTPAFSWPELDGKPVVRLLRYWSEMLIYDPESRGPGIAGVQGYIDAGSPHITPDMRSMTVLFIEPTHNRLDVNSAYLCSNMMPETIPDNIDDEKAATPESPIVEVPFSALTTVKNIRTMAKAFLDAQNKAGYLPSALGLMVNPESPIDANVAEDKAQGYQTGLDNAAAAIVDQ